MCRIARLSMMSHIALPETTKRSIIYNLSIFSTVQMAKPKTKRGDPKSDFFRLDEDEDWDTMKVQVMAKIDSLLKPATISYDDYEISFAIPRYSPQPMALDGNNKYLYMVEHALKAKSGPSAKILIEAKALVPEKVRSFCAQHDMQLATWMC
jgi:hypothetical protein